MDNINENSKKMLQEKLNKNMNDFYTLAFSKNTKGNIGNILETDNFMLTHYIYNKLLDYNFENSELELLLILDNPLKIIVEIFMMEFDEILNDFLSFDNYSCYLEKLCRNEQFQEFEEMSN